ncbi:hypothetical protein F2P81_010966 [Scophthalmus maximus]|uniref:Uncharacterized protein n=1 Tax=Scophthalmus maximus TaxID=52904 RepID=A0A6A4SX25_SCOMX|nr:hypothetical protein F2P81_010966 [Scophthalmus maximus]
MGLLLLKRVNQKHNNNGHSVSPVQREVIAQRQIKAVPYYCLQTHELHIQTGLGQTGTDRNRLGETGTDRNRPEQSRTDRNRPEPTGTE